jgi:hypothetical protein
VGEAPRRRATRAEREQRLTKVCELLVARVTPGAVVRFACETWGIGERAAETYLSEARERLCEKAGLDRPVEFGKAFGGYELIMRRQLKGGDLGAARATLDKLVALLGLAAPRGGEAQTLEAIAREIARLETALAAREEQTP